MLRQSIAVSKHLTASLLLTGATGATGAAEDMLLCDGLVAARGGEVRYHPRAPGARVLDLRGFVLLPAPVEAHAHLDKAFLGERATNKSGDLPGAIAAMAEAYPTMTDTDIMARARRGIDIALRRGFTGLRTHVDCNVRLGLAAVDSLLRLRDEYQAMMTIQVVALVGSPLTGPEGAPLRRLLVAAVEHGIDVVGGAPSLDPHPSEAIRLLVDVASDADLPIDLHLDETTEPGAMDVDCFADAVEAKGRGGQSVASHCVRLGQQDLETAQRTARRLAAVGIAVVTLPQTNLFLQGRGTKVRIPRALTPLEVLRNAGCVVAGGGDNWRDPFNPVGRIDPFETASLLVSAGHMDPREAYAAVSFRARRALGLVVDPLAKGEEADLLAIKGSSLAEVIADATEERIVFRAGRVVSRTAVVSVVDE